MFAPKHNDKVNPPLGEEVACVPVEDDTSFALAALVEAREHGVKRVEELSRSRTRMESVLWTYPPQQDQ